MRSRDHNQSTYRPELDLLRFVAFLLVFLHHVFPREVGNCPAWMSDTGRTMMVTVANMCGFGLSLFFGLSAFLITDLLVREKIKTGTVHVRSFYVRRILRIWPLYFLAIAIGLLFYLWIPRARDLAMLGMYALMIGNWFYVSSAWTSHPTTPLWSISVEEQFYLFWPAVVRFLDPRGQFAICAALVLAAVATEVALARAHAPINTTVWTNSFVQFETFAAGAAMALCLRGRSIAFGARARLALAALAIGLWFAAVYIFGAKSVSLAQSAPLLVFGVGCAAAGAIAILVAVLGLKVPASSPFVHLGRISFGLYVYHAIFLNVAKAAEVLFGDVFTPHLSSFPLAILSLIPTIVAAELSYRYFERPFLRLKDRFTFVRSEPARVEFDGRALPEGGVSARA